MVTKRLPSLRRRGTALAGGWFSFNATGVHFTANVFYAATREPPRLQKTHPPLLRKEGSFFFVPFVFFVGNAFLNAD